MNKFCVMSVEDSYDNIDLIQTLNEQDEEIEKLHQELQRKDNNWNELKRYIKASDDCWDLQAVLDKIKELENGNK